MQKSFEVYYDNFRQPKKASKLEAFSFAERGGFEPPVRFPARMFSKHVVSATHPPLQVFDLLKDCKYIGMNSNSIL